MSFLGHYSSKRQLPFSPQFHLGGLQLYHDSHCRIYEDENAVLVIRGSLFDCDETALLSSEKKLEDIYGMYAYVYIHKRRDRIVVGTDKLGFHSLFYAEQDNRFLFGIFLPHLKHRLNRPTPDYEAWEETLNTGDIIGHKTAIREISRLRQGQKIIIDAGRWRLENFWSFEPSDPVSLETYIRDNNDLLDDAIAKTRKHSLPKLMPLTGGQDSRRLALAAKRQDLDFSAITQQWPTEFSYDTDGPIAAHVARHLGIPHKIIPLPDDVQAIRDKFYRDYWLGFESQTHSWAVNMARHMPPKSLIYDGIIGDITVNGHYFLILPSYRDVYDNLEALNDLVAPHKPTFKFSSLPEGALHERCREELLEYPEDYNRLNMFKIFNHTRRNIGSWLQLFIIHGHDASLPYSYLPLFLQSLTLSPAYRKHEIFPHRLCMQKQDHEVADHFSTRDMKDETLLIEKEFHKIRVNSRYPGTVIRRHPKIDAILSRPFRWKMEDFLADQMGLAPLNEKNDWKNQKLLYLTLFLMWLETDESELPPLYTGEPPFLKKLNGLLA